MDSQFYDNLQSAPDKDPVTGEIRYSGNNPYANQQNEPVSQQYPQQYMYQAGMGGYNPQMYQPSAAVPYIPYGAQNPGAGVYGYGGAVPVNQGYQGQIPGYQPGQYYGAPTQPGPVFQPAAPVYQGGYQQPASSQMYQQAIDANRMKAVNDENSRLRAELDELRKLRDNVEKELEANRVAAKKAREEADGFRRELDSALQKAEDARQQIDEIKRQSETDLAALKENAEARQNEALAQLRMQFAAQENERQQRLAENRESMEQQWQRRLAEARNSMEQQWQQRLAEARESMEQQWQQTLEERRKLDEERRELEEARDEVNGIQQSFEGEKDRINEDRQRLQEELAVSEQFRKQLEEEKAAFEESKQRIEKEKEEFESSKALFSQQIAAFEQDVQKLNDDRNEFQNSVQQLESDRYSTEELRRQLEAEKDSTEELKRQLESERDSTEELRKQLETERDSTEELKKQLEADREGAEEIRRQLEADRDSAEELRNQLEAERESNEEYRRQLEADKIGNEELRQQLEADRENNEEIRRQLESDRNGTEELRKQLEADRESNEEFRRQLESDKNSTEELKRQLEAERESSEELRKQLETERENNEEVRKQLEADREGVEQYRKQLEDEKTASEELKNKLEEDRIALDRSTQELGMNKSVIEQAFEQLNQERNEFEQSLQRFQLDRNEFEKQRVIAEQEKARLVEERLASDRLRHQLEEDRTALEESRQQSLDELAARERILQEAERQSKAQREALDENRMREAESLKAFFEAQRAEAEETRLNLEKERAEIELLRQTQKEKAEEELKEIEEKRELLKAEQEELERRTEELEKSAGPSEAFTENEADTDVSDDLESPFSHLFDATAEFSEPAIPGEESTEQVTADLAERHEEAADVTETVTEAVLADAEITTEEPETDRSITTDINFAEPVIQETAEEEPVAAEVNEPETAEEEPVAAEVNEPETAEEEPVTAESNEPETAEEEAVTAEVNKPETTGAGFSDLGAEEIRNDFDSDLDAFKLIDSEEDLFGNDGNDEKQSFSDLLDQFTAQLDLSDLLVPFGEVVSASASNLTEQERSVSEAADDREPLVSDAAVSSADFQNESETVNGSEEDPQRSENEELNADGFSGNEETVPADENADADAGEYPSGHDDEAAGSEVHYGDIKELAAVSEEQTISDDHEKVDEETASSDGAFDFDAAVDGLAAAVLTNDSWLYNENNLAPLGDEMLKVSGLTSKYYVNETDCSYPSFKEVTVGFPVGSCTAVISSVPFCAYAFVRALARPEEIAEGTVTIADRQLTRDDILYIGSDRLIDKKGRTIDWLMGMTGEKKEVLLEVLEQCGMKELSELELETISYPQRMLVLLIAVSYSTTPVVLINDPQFEVEEIDVTSACAVFKLLASAGKTVMISGRSPRLLRSVANRVLAIHYGNPVFAGSYLSFIEENRAALVLFHSDRAEEIEMKLSEDERFAVVRDRDIVEIQRADGSSATEQDAIDAAKEAGVPIEAVRSGDKGFTIAYREVFKATPKI